MMKRIQSLLLLMLGASTSLIAQKDGVIRNPELIPIVFLGETEPLMQYTEDSDAVNEITKTEKPGYHPKDDWILNETVNPLALPNGADPAWQKDYPRSTSAKRSLSYNFDGIGNTNVSPADPCVDVGPNHVIQMINGSSGAYFVVFDKNGNALTNATYLDNYMGFPGGAGDPIVLYDELADRWLMSEFSSSGNRLMVAISTTPDPLGSWYSYTYTANSFPDYPKYSIWSDSYVVTTNESSPTIYALNRSQMLSGSSGTAQRFTMSSFGTIGFQAAVPVSLNGTNVPPAGTPAMVMRMRDDAWSGSSSDALEIWELDLDWSNSNNSTLTQVATLGVQPFESELCGYTSFSCIDQPNSNTNLDPLREILMNRIHYRNFGSHESIVCCHVTDVDGNDRAGIRWYELRRTNGLSGSWSIYQEGTYSPDVASRWMPSIGISATGNIGLAYSVSSNSIFPSLRYTGRRSCDPLNVMTEPETVIVDGTSPNNSNRWGDYHAMGLDPADGETFWFTGGYGTGNAWGTRVAAFDLPGCSPSVQFTNTDIDTDESDADVPNGCLPYFDLTVSITIASEPSEIATVSISSIGGSAQEGEDFELFNTSLTFSNANLSGDVVVRIYNDDYVEGDETIILGYTLNANGGNAIEGSVNQSITINISDDDFEPENATVPVVLLTEDFESGFGGFTTSNVSGDTAWQLGDEAIAETQAYNIPSSNTTTFAYVNDDDCDCDMDQVNLDFPTLDLNGVVTAQVQFDTYFESNTYQGNLESAGLYVSVNQGTYALVGSLMASEIDGSWITQQYSLDAFVGENDVRLRITYSDGTGWLYGCTVDNVVVSGETGIDIQTEVNSSTEHSAYLGPNKTVHFYDSSSGNVMATIVNTSGWDYGCVSVEVDRSGANPSAAVFNSNSTADYLHSKTLSIIPENNNANGTYDLTLYYKENEVSGWENFTGNSRTNAEVIKVSGSPVDAVNPSNFSSFSIGSSIASVGAFGSDVTFTSSFNTGFSGFGVGILNTLVTNVNEILPDVTIYPNPTKGIFTVSGLQIGSSYYIFDSAGSLVLIEECVSNEQVVKLSGQIASGKYVLVSEKGGKLGRVNFIISR